MDFATQRKTRLAELEQSFLVAMRASKFADALRFAQTAIELDPGAATARYKPFIPLLEEKLALDETDDDSEEDDAEVTAGNGHAEDNEAAESSEEDDEEESEEEEGEDEDAASEVPTIPEVDSIALDAKNLKLTKDARKKMRESLSKSIHDLKTKELCDKLQASDPLLGA